MEGYHPLREARRRNSNGGYSKRGLVLGQSSVFINDENVPPIKQQQPVGSPFPLPPDFNDIQTPSDTKSGGQTSPLVRLLKELQDFDQTPQRTPLRDLSLSFINTQGTQVSPDHNFRTELSDVQLSCPRPPALAASPPAPAPAPVPAPLLRFKKDPTSGEFHLVRRAAESDVTQFAALLHTNIRQVKARESGIDWQTPEDGTTHLQQSYEDTTSNASSWSVCSHFECQRTVDEANVERRRKSISSTKPIEHQHHRVRRVEHLPPPPEEEEQLDIRPITKEPNANLTTRHIPSVRTESPNSEFELESDSSNPQHGRQNGPEFETESDIDTRPACGPLRVREGQRGLRSAVKTFPERIDTSANYQVPQVPQVPASSRILSHGVELETDSDVKSEGKHHSTLPADVPEDLIELLEPSAILSPENAAKNPPGRQRWGAANNTKRTQAPAGVLSPPGRRRTHPHPAFSPEQKHYYDGDEKDSPPPEQWHPTSGRRRSHPAFSPEQIHHFEDNNDHQDTSTVVPPPGGIPHPPLLSPEHSDVQHDDTFDVSAILDNDGLIPPPTSLATDGNYLDGDTPYKRIMKQQLRQDAECEKTPIRSLLDSLEHGQRPSTWAEQQQLMDSVLSDELIKLCGTKSQTKDCGSSPIRWGHSTISTQVSPTKRDSNTTQTSQWEFVNGNGCYGPMDQMAPPPVSSRSVSAASTDSRVKKLARPPRGLVQQAASRLQRKPSVTRKYRKSAKPERLADSAAADLGWSVKTTESEPVRKGKVAPVTPPSLHDIRMAKHPKRVSSQPKRSQRK